MRFILTLLLLFLSALPASAATLDMSVFRGIPVLEGGRLKPLDSFARGMLATFSGEENPGHINPNTWLADCLFLPSKAIDEPIFAVPNANLRHRLGLTERKIALYSYRELTDGLGATVPQVQALAAQDRKALSPDDRDLLAIHDHALLYTQILRSFSLILPLEVALPDSLKGTHDLTYLELQKSQQQLEEAARKIVKRKGEDFKSYTDEEKKTTFLAYQLSLLGEAASTNQLMRLIPASWDKTGQDWRAPWAILNEGQGSPQTAELLNVWKELARAWQSQDAVLWQSASSKAATLPLQMAGLEDRAGRLELEVAYNLLAPFKISTGLYIVAFLLALAYLIGLRPVFLYSGLIALSLGAFVHAGGIATRIILLERPPVSTLYESLIFVAWVCAIIGLLLEKKIHGGIGLLLGAVTALFLTLLATSFGSGGDTLLMLTAVLNTQFWLATHVLCITFGYGWCIAAAVMAHLVLFARAFNLLPAERLATQTTTLMILSLVALLFTSIGTILGGIWADQSWGRFWGWDPKENGALLIVLWLVWVMHGKLSGHLKPTALLAALSFLSVIVGCAWIGVNLLGVGLHSYGFADGVMIGLGLFTLIEVLIIGTLWRLSERPHAA